MTPTTQTEWVVGFQFPIESPQPEEEVRNASGGRVIEVDLDFKAKCEDVTGS